MKVSLDASLARGSPLVEMRMNADGPPGATAFVAFQEVFTLTLPPGDCEKIIAIEVGDAAGNVTCVQPDPTIVLDTTAPTLGTLTLGDGSGYTRSTTVAFAITSPDAGAKGYAVRVEGDLAAGPAEYAYPSVPGSLELTSGDGEKVVRVSLVDEAGNTTTRDARLVLDTQAPTEGSVKVNGGAPFTNSLSALVELSAKDADLVQISHEGSFDTEPLQPFSSTALGLLPPGDGVKTIEARFADRAGNASAPVSDTIILDMTAPTAPRIATKPVITRANTKEVILAVRSTDASRITYELLGGQYGAWMPVGPLGTADWIFELKHRGVPTDGRYNLGVRAKDEAGNVSGEDSVTVIRDTSAPSAPSELSSIERDGSVVLSWQPSPEGDVAGYRVFYGAVDSANKATSSAPSRTRVRAPSTSGMSRSSRSPGSRTTPRSSWRSRPTIRSTRESPTARP